MNRGFYFICYIKIQDMEEKITVFEEAWSDEKYRKLQGTCPVIFLSFADIKANNFSLAREKICMIIQKLYSKFDFCWIAVY